MPGPESFWDQRYAEDGFAYGAEPNDFVRAMAERIPPGPVLCLAEGQGRNAVFLAARGFTVTAMDQSPVGLAKASALAAERGVALTTVIGDLRDFVIAPGAWAGIVSVFVHMLPPLRREVHARAAAGLAPGGVFVYEAYGPPQLALRSGGPEEPERLIDLATLKGDLPGLEFEVAWEGERDVLEGRYHNGRSATVQLLARRPRA